jgi:hypothetical protein
MAGRRWSKKEENVLRELFADKPTREIARQLGRSYGSTAQHAIKIGLAKSEAFKESVQSGMFVRGRNYGKEYRFPKGFVPWNKGKKYNPGGRSVETRFKKGRPVTYKDVYIHKSKGRPYKWVYAGTGKRKLLHRVTWEKYFGPVPKGHNVQFLDGDTLNCDISNLYLISRKKQMRRNSIQRFPKELIRTMKTLGRLKKKIKSHEKQD